MRKITVEIFSHEVTILVADSLTDKEIDEKVEQIVMNEVVWYEEG